MTPERKITICGHCIEEFYWNGRLVVYVDSRRFDGDWGAALASARGGA